MLFQIPQRYRFSSKSQHERMYKQMQQCCFRYHKGTDFQANHNQLRVNKRFFSLFQIPQRYRFSSKSQRNQCWLTIYKVVLDTTKVQIFKQITTILYLTGLFVCCFRYHKGTDFQANHNELGRTKSENLVVLDTTKVQIFKQITTTLLIKVML